MGVSLYLTIQSDVERTKKSTNVKREVLWQKAGAEGFGGYYGKKSLKSLVQCLAVVRKANRIMGCINRGSEPKSKDMILLLYGLILSLYKELVGANQTHCTAGLITLSSEAYCPGQGPVHRTARMTIPTFPMKEME